MSLVASVIGGILNLGGTVLSTIFNVKKEKANIIQSSLGILGDVNASDADKSRAAAMIIVAENNAGGLASMWRPIAMLTFLSLIVSSWFGYIPPDLPPNMINRLFDLMELGISGYIGARSLEKIVSQINVGKIVNKFVDKFT